MVRRFESDSTMDADQDGNLGQQSKSRHEREALLAAAFREAPIALVFTTSDGRILDANATYSQMVGYSLEELTERDLTHFTHPDDIQATRQFYRSLQSPAKPTGVIEKRYLHKDGHVVWARVSATIRQVVEEHPGQLVAIIEDISEHKRAEQALAERARMAALGAQIGAALTKIAPLQDTLQECALALVTHLDAAFARIWTLAAGEDVLELQASAGLYTHLDGAHARIPVGSFKIGMIADQRTPHISNNVVDGPRVSDREWARREGMVAFAGHPLIVDDKVIGVMGLFARHTLEPAVLTALASVADSIAVGITRRTAEDALTRQWRLFDTALSNTVDLIYTLDLEGRFIYANRALLSLWQKPFNEIVGKNFFELDYPVELANRLCAQMKHVIATREILRASTPYVGADGRTGTYEYIFVPVINEGGQVAAVAGSTRDITEHEQMKEALLLAERKLQQVFSQAPVAILVLRGRDFVIELANDPYRALFSGKDLIGHRFKDVLPELDQEVWRVFNRVLDTGEPFAATEWPLRYDYNNDGVPEDHWFNVVYNPLREADGTISGFIAVLTDVTGQVHSRQSLERANRELEEFAYVASHDLQEPLRMVNIYTDLLLRRHMSDDPQAVSYARFIRDGAKRMETLIRDLLTFSRTAHTEARSFGDANLAEALKEALEVVKVGIEASAAVVTCDTMPMVRGETKQLAHVFQNLLSNALKYRKKDIPPVISVTAKRQDNDWIICVHDNGIGFDLRYADQIFGLFKRLHKDNYPGTGLGLAICKRIVERYGGRIWAESELDKGSAFYFALNSAA